MSANLVLMGPSTAGKTSLMLELARQSPVYDFTIDRTRLTRPRRPGEGDEENIFLSPEAFEAERHNFLFPFQTSPDYEYGIPLQRPLQPREVRMRILMPVHAKQFRALVAPTPTLLCAISPRPGDPKMVITKRDPNLSQADKDARMARFFTDNEDAKAIADIRFQNFENITSAARSLGELVVSEIANLNLSN